MQIDVWGRCGIRVNRFLGSAAPFSLNTVRVFGQFSARDLASIVRCRSLSQATARHLVKSHRISMRVVWLVGSSWGFSVCDTRRIQDELWLGAA